jgi:prefoldin subunit 5
MWKRRKQMKELKYRISTLIEELEKLKAEHGDLEVLFDWVRDPLIDVSEADAYKDGKRYLIIS